MSKNRAETTGYVQLTTSLEQIRDCFTVMQQLRPHLTSEQEFIEQVQRQMGQGYRLVFIRDEEQVRALAGFRFVEFLAWGKILYIDDLVSDAVARKNGYGSQLLQWMIQEAKKVGCAQVHLDSGSQRHDAHRLYLKHHFKIIGYHFALDLSSLE